MLSSGSIRQRVLPRLLKSATSNSPIQSRSLFTVPALADDGLDYATNGIGKLMSAEQFRISWTENQGRLVGELNRLTQGTTLANSTTKQVLLQTARDPDQAALFNYASMAHNNHFYFTTLSPKPTRPSDGFARELEASFSSASSFRAMFLASAEAMFAPGFVWLVNDSSVGAGGGKYAIVNTYAAGSPYAGAAFRKQAEFAATSDNGMRMDGNNMSQQTGRNLFGVGWQRGVAQRGVVPGGYNANPLLCVSTWEHMYLRDFGVDGKRKYLEAWWDSIDWLKVERYSASSSKSREAEQI